MKLEKNLRLRGSHGVHWNWIEMILACLRTWAQRYGGALDGMKRALLFSIKRSKLILTMRWRGVWLAALQWLLAASMMRSNIARVPSA